MKNRIRILAVTAVTLSGLSLVAPAHAEDQRPCVSKSEYLGVKVGQTRNQIEARWEVADVASYLGSGVNRYYVEYPLCRPKGHGHGHVTVGYQHDSHLWRIALAFVIHDG